MKTVTSMFFLALLVIVGCASSLSSQSKDITIEYQAMTRGSNREVVLTHNELAMRSIAGPHNGFVTTVSRQDWNDVLKELEKVELNKISELEAPTSKRLYDGALIATLTIKMKDTTYRSSSFDHGHPPAEIAALVNRVVRMSGLEKGKE